MRWTNGSRLFLGGTTVVALLMVHGLSNQAPSVHDASDSAKRLPTKYERLADANPDIAKVTFQADDDDNDFEPVVNSLRSQPALDSATAEPTQVEPTQPDLGEFELEFGATDDAPTVADYELSQPNLDPVDSAETTEYQPSFQRPSNWQTNPMFDQPISESTDDRSAYLIGSSAKATAPSKEKTAVAKDRIKPDDSITPASPSALGSSIYSTRPAPSTSFAPQQPRLARYSVSDSVAQKAAQHIEYGKSLARRGATFAARQEFYNALRLVSQSIDSQLDEPVFTKALSDALTALREASDFYISDSESQIGMDLATVVATHSSKIVTAEMARKSTPIQLMQQYYSFAQDRFILAGGRNIVSAEALFSLGKLHSVMSKHDPHADRLDIAKAMVYHRACLECDPSNYKSANELGALLARSGQLQEAKGVLKSSLMIQQTPQAWKNLAIVHQRIGEAQLAALAQQEYVINSQAVIANNVAGPIQWMSPKQFTATTPIEYHESTARRPGPPAQQAQPPVAPKKADDKLINRIKKMF